MPSIPVAPPGKRQLTINPPARTPPNFLPLPLLQQRNLRHRQDRQESRRGQLDLQVVRAALPDQHEL